MMKSRITTYILIVSVLVIWSVVAWKVFFSSSDSYVPTPPSSVGHSIQPEHSDFLHLNYGDPFFRGIETPETAPFTEESDIPSAVPFVIPDTPSEPPALIYAGFISTGDNITYLFEKEGVLHSLSRGEQYEDYILTEGSPDSVIFNKMGYFFTIHIQD